MAWLSGKVPAVTDSANYSGKPALMYSEWKTLLDHVYEASKRIRTIDPHDKNQDEHMIKAATSAIQQASVVYVLGYGFDPLNNDRLALLTHLRLPPSSQKYVMFTNYGDNNKVNKTAGRLFMDEYDRFLPDRPPACGAPHSPWYAEKSIRNVYDALSNDFEALEEQRLGSR
jgi:hypothetical protein